MKPYTITFTDYRLAHRLYNRRGCLIMAGIWLLVLTAATLIHRPDRFADWLAMVPGIFILLFIPIGLYGLFMWFWLNHLYQNTPDVHKELRLSLPEEGGLLFREGESHTHYQPSDVLRIYEHPRLLVFHLKTGELCIVPTRACESEEELAAVRQAMTPPAG